MPDFGKRTLADLSSEDGDVEFLDGLVGLRERTSTRDGKPLAARSVRNVATAVRVFFADAVERKVVRRNPALGWKLGKHLPKRTRRQAGDAAPASPSRTRCASRRTRRSRDERRVQYALRFLGGPRPGEVASARWRDLDKTCRPLWRLALSRAWNSHSKSEKATKTGAELNIPVHPMAQALLERWEATGRAEFVGRNPRPDDLILPRQDGEHRAVSTTNQRFKKDLELLGIRCSASTRRARPSATSPCARARASST